MEKWYEAIEPADDGSSTEPEIAAIIKAILLFSTAGTDLEYRFSNNSPFQMKSP
jgi:hypothetical protein